MRENRQSAALNLLIAWSFSISFASAFTLLRSPRSLSSPNAVFRPEILISQSNRRTENSSFRFPFGLLESREGNYVQADDIAAVQKLFSNYCDEDGLMTKVVLTETPPFSEMLKEEDLLMDELEDIWNAAPKFPDVAGEESRIDVDSFVQIYRDVDDLFEDNENDEDEASTVGSQPSQRLKHDDANNMDSEKETVETELEREYEKLCDKEGLISKDTLKGWDETQKLLNEGLLGEDEFEELWSKTKKSPGSNEIFLDVDGFLSYNVALDALFEFEEDDEENFVDGPTAGHGTPRKMVEGDDLTPGVLFAAIADEDYLVGMDELKYWVELQDMLAEGDLMSSELQETFDEVKKAGSDKLDEDAFIKLYEEIDSLFEEDVDDATGASSSQKVKEDLISFLDIIIEEDTLPCGLDCNEKDKKQVLNIVQALEDQPSNYIAVRNGQIEMVDLAGTWELLYSSSSAMKFNQGLSGLGGSVPNGKFGGLKQILKASKFLTDVEYKEKIEVSPSSASFDVTITGSWDIRSSVSLFTGKPSTIVEIEPDRVNYGFTSTRADHWKSLGPMNQLDLTYLDENMRVMRGCTSADTIFVFKRVD